MKFYILYLYIYMVQLQIKVNGCKCSAVGLSLYLSIDRYRDRWVEKKNVNWSFGRQFGKMLLLYVIMCDGY